MEIDESKFGKAKYNRAREIGGRWVFGMYEGDSKRVKIMPVPDRTAETLVAIIKQYTEPGSTIYSESWRSYHNLTNEGYDQSLRKLR